MFAKPTSYWNSAAGIQKNKKKDKANKNKSVITSSGGSSITSLGSLSSTSNVDTHSLAKLRNELNNPKLTRWIQKQLDLFVTREYCGDLDARARKRNKGNSSFIQQDGPNSNQDQPQNLLHKFQNSAEPVASYIYIYIYVYIHVYIFLALF
jgi:hypothetical protein